jgi:hypothetical protein
VKAAATPRALTPMSDTFSKIEVITGVARRSRFSTELELAVVAETMQPRVTNQPCCSPPQAVAEPGVPLEAGDFDQPDAHMGRRERAAASRSLARRLNFDRSGPTNAITRRLRTHTEFARGEPAERGLSLWLDILIRDHNPTDRRRLLQPTARTIRGSAAGLAGKRAAALGRWTKPLSR